MPAALPRPLVRRRRVYMFKQGAWHLVGERDYLYPLTAVEFVRVWPARAETHPQSATPPT